MKREIYEIIEPVSIIISILAASNVPLMAGKITGIIDITILEAFAPIGIALILSLSFIVGLFFYYGIRKLFE